jgi:hypothetical protein
VHETVAAADGLPAPNPLVMVFTPEPVQLAAAVAGRAEGHHQLLFIEGSLEGVRTDFHDRDFDQIPFLKGRVAIDIDFDQAVRILRLDRLEIGFGLLT